MAYLEQSGRSLAPSCVFLQARDHAYQGVSLLHGLCLPNRVRCKNQRGRAVVHARYLVIVHDEINLETHAFSRPPA